MSLFLLVSISSRRGLGIAAGSAFLVDLNKSMAMSSDGKYVVELTKCVVQVASFKPIGSHPSTPSVRDGHIKGQ